MDAPLRAGGVTRFAGTGQARIIASGEPRSGDAARLPIMRPGNTVCVPSIAQSPWRVALDTCQDLVSFLPIIALIGAL